MLEGKTTFWQRFLQTFDNDGDAQSTLIFSILIWISLSPKKVYFFFLGRKAWYQLVLKMPCFLEICSAYRDKKKTNKQTNKKLNKTKKKYTWTERPSRKAFPSSALLHAFCSLEPFPDTADVMQGPDLECNLPLKKLPCLIFSHQYLKYQISFNLAFECWLQDPACQRLLPQ